MIMQGKTPRSLSWTGSLAVLALGLFLLPFLPVRAQERYPRDPQKADKPGETTDQQISALKMKLRLLEEQKALENDLGALKKQEHSLEMDKARATAAALGKEVEDKRRALRDAEGRHQKALAVLAKLEGKPAAQYHYSPDSKIYWYQLDPTVKQSGNEIHWTPYTEYKVNPKEVQNKYQIYVDPKSLDTVKGDMVYGYRFTPDEPAGAAKDKSGDLEKRLELLARQIEELRRELKESRRQEKPQSK